MFKWLSNYRKKIKSKFKKNMYINGFDYAAGALLRKERTSTQLISYFYDSEMDSFDYGVIGAINKLKEIGFIEEELDFLEEPFKF